jgi:hypothetical protein
MSRARSQPNTTARYSHLFDDPLREATERAVTILGGVASGQSADVVNLKTQRKTDRESSNWHIQKGPNLPHNYVSSMKLVEEWAQQSGELPEVVLTNFGFQRKLGRSPSELVRCIRARFIP